MANSNSKVNLVVTAQDKASGKLGKIDDAIGGIAKTAAGFIAANIAGNIAQGFNNMVQSAAKFETISAGFERNFENSAAGLKELQEASKGTISQLDLMTAANKAALLGVSSDTKKLAQLMDTARLRGAELGLTTTQAFDDIVTGIGRGSPLILDNLGIKIPAALKETMEGMDEAAKTQALLDFAIADGIEIAKDYENQTISNAQKMAQFDAKMADLQVRIGTELAGAVVAGGNVISGTLDALVGVVTNDTELMSRAWGSFGELITDTAASFGIDMLDVQRDFMEFVVGIQLGLADAETRFQIFGENIKKGFAFITGDQEGYKRAEENIAGLGGRLQQIGEVDAAAVALGIQRIQDTVVGGMPTTIEEVGRAEDAMFQFGHEADMAGIGIEELGNISEDTFARLKKSMDPNIAAGRELARELNEVDKALRRIGPVGATVPAGPEVPAFATGGDFVTNGPQMIMVGDNPGGKERVQVTPMSSPNINGPQSSGITINVNGAMNPALIAEQIRNILAADNTATNLGLNPALS